jgi:anaerobic magnesium-protoporphyrin IX monomethyl ester cyclase
MHSMDFTIDMLRSFVDRGIRHFAFIDEMISPKHFEKLAAAIKEADLDISYYALTKPTRDFRPQTLLDMAESGCKYLLWGMESGNQRVLDLMDKGSKVEDVSWVLKRTYAAGIVNHVFMICGFPTETEDEFAQTVKFLDDHKDYIYAVHRGTFSLEPESPIFEDQRRFGITRSWLIRDNPTGGRWGYECERGMSMERTKEVFTAALPFLREFNPHARLLANFRDHALLAYSRFGTDLRPDARQFPTMNFSKLPPMPYEVTATEQRSLKC